MDGVSAAASVLAIVGFALTSTKVVYDTISVIKGAPKAVQQTILALAELERILLRLAKLNERLESVDADLQSLIQQCATDLKAFEKKTGCLRTISAETGLSKAWIRVKTMLKQDDFQRMWEGINRHVLALGMQLQLIGTDFSITHASNLQRLDERLKATSLSTTRIKDGVIGARGDSASCHAVTHQKIEELSSGVDELSNVSTGQSKKIEEMLGQLQDLIAKHSNQGTRIWEVPEKSDDGGNGRTPATQQTKKSEEGLGNSLARLRRLAAEKERSFYSSEAENIIDDIEQLLNAASSMAKTSIRKRNGKKRKRNQDQYTDSDLSDDDELQRRGIKRIQGFLATSQCLVVNPQTRSRPTRTSGRKYERRDLRRSYCMSDGTIAINVKSSMPKNVMNDLDDHEDLDREVIEVFEGDITFLPNSVPNTRISISFQQRLTFQGSLLRKPSISFSAILPNNSEVFLRIEHGDLEGLLQLLTQGAASLTDRDSEGRSLLNYACMHEDLNICKFLVENGADVESIEKVLDGDSMVSMLELPGTIDIDVTSDELSWTLAYRRVLLEANADPTLETNYSLFRMSLYLGTVESFRLVLDLGHEFIDLEEKDERGNSALMMLLRSGRSYTEMVALLLRRGADPNSRNKHERSSLHYCIRYSEPDACLDELILLINAGADVRAMDCWGESVTEHAYHTPSAGLYTKATGNRGKIWQEALTACGFDAAAFRQVYSDAGGQTRNQYGHWVLVSDWQEEASVSDQMSDFPEVKIGSVDSNELFIGSEAEEEEPHSSNYEEEYPSHDQYQNSNRGYREYSISAQGPMDNPRFAAAQTVLPPFHTLFESAEIWQLRPPTTGFVTELRQNESFQPSFDASVNTTTTREASLTDDDPWAWRPTGQNHGQDPSAFMPYPLDPQSQHGVPHRSYNASAHPFEAQRANAWLQTQDYNLLEADANIWNE